MALTTFSGPVVSQNGFIDSSFTNAERDAIVNPQPGLLIYNTTVNEYQVYNGTGWQVAFGGGMVTYTLGVDFFNPAPFTSRYLDQSVDFYNVVPALKTALDALSPGDTLLLNGAITVTIDINNGESVVPDTDPAVRDYWILMTGASQDPPIPITSFSIPLTP
jgi:hypothetical protein